MRIALIAWHGELSSPGFETDGPASEQISWVRERQRFTLDRLAQDKRRLDGTRFRPAHT